ncbi:hypothetical protein TOT_030000607 [Theileria orientalis strain Shintoku]|uniref:Uncharacterized protein n=1 Tax=Theileria orientalis strain Shintoku TaxID=869250 RepID=J4D9F3_THEOR|nr:hypothetical protein TOT_030000607 [Theileria orientalis strain Shintoku]PVC49768.1 hypothetical protein MACL_00002824 [Theileria orientalis]BAM41345.1 hypothetical protein TOT_030000607 [Theileria orientalis strain Shintoku]|eukprot:XP_009691646.1 hypothetical protein TOT_030000607 [Theileria orientalis strain Shintoku]
MRKTTTTKKAVKRTKDKRLKTIYENEPEVREKMDEIVGLLYKLLSKASTGADSKDSMTVGQLCRGLNRLGFKTGKDQLLDNLLFLNDARDSYRLELVHTEDGANVTDTHYPPISGSNELSSLSLNRVDLETLRRIFLNVGLKLSPTNTIF